MKSINDLGYRGCPWFLSLFFLSGIAGLFHGPFLSHAAIPDQPREVKKLYTDFCANCHGVDLRGAQASSLFDGVWRFGADDESIARGIREGYPNQGMESFKKTFSDAEVRSLVVYIRERSAQLAASREQQVPPVDNQVVKSQWHTFRVEKVVDGLATPWSIAFLPDGRNLVTELPGNLRYIENGKLSPPIAGTPSVRAKGQGGLLDVALHPGYSSNGWVYLSFSHAATNAGTKDGGMTSVVRGRIRNNQWVDEQIVFRAPPWTYRSTDIHFGSRIVFDHQGYLYFSIGERGTMEHAQDLTRPNGKIHRLFDDGRIPPDNPFVRQSNAVPSIFSYGHRNPQGLAVHPATGEVWETEHGPRGGDELNWLQSGHNYGWPLITYGINYNGLPISDKTEMPGLEQPVVHWTPSIAVCSMDFYTGRAFPYWVNNVFVTALAQQELRRLVLDGHKVLSQEVMLKNIARIRDVASGPDGYLYLVLNKPDKVIRLVPASE